MSIEEKIFEIYEEIINSKKSILEVTDVYNNIDFKDGVVGNSAPSRDNINTALLADIETAARNAGVKVDVTTAITGHHTGKTRHTSGNAVDIAIINGKSVSTANRADADKLVNQLLSLGYVKNSETSNAKAVLTFGFPGHDNHVHVSNLTGAASAQTPATLDTGEETGTTPAKPATGTTPAQTTTPAADKENDVEDEFLGSMGAQLGLKEDEDIFEYFNLILNKNKKFINEVSATSSSLFGGSSVMIPSDGAHKGQSGWQSNNAWDIPTPIGSPVYAVADGVVLTFSDYGPKPIHRNGKTLFGAGFTVDSSDGLPDVYYTHLKDCTVKKGDSIECGQLLGYVMDFPGSDYDHLHIGVESGHNIREFLNSDGTLKCGGRISGEAEPIQSTSSSDKTTSDKTTSDVITKPEEDDIETKFIKSIAGQLGLKEEKFYSKLGDRISFSFGRATIPSGNNSKIKSPVNGVINNYHSESSCTNQITVEHNFEGQSYYLQFCGISHPEVRDTQRVSKGTVLGKTSSDVIVSLYNKGWERVSLEKMLDKEIDVKNPVNKKVDANKSVDNDKKKEGDKKKEDDKKEKEYYDPYGIWFFNKVKDMMPSISKGGEPKISNFFNKHSLSNKKVDENIERIKKLL